MIKKFEKAFSLAELLIVMAIIAIITAMSFSIAKKGIKSAYNLFFYTGYNGIYEAIGDAIDYGYSPDSANLGNSDFIEHITKIMSAQKSVSGNDVKIEAPNGITYTISYKTDYILENESGPIYQIIMKVPYQKTGNESEAKSTLYYLPNLRNGMLIPYGVITADNNVNLQRRQDLLPFYIDDGSVGRILEYSNGYSYSKPVFTNFREAFCQLYGSLTLEGVSYVSCSGILAGKKGLLKVANPRKIF